MPSESHDENRWSGSVSTETVPACWQRLGIYDTTRQPTVTCRINSAKIFGSEFNGLTTNLQGNTEMSDVAERVKKVVVEHLGVDEDKVTEGASFIDDLGADSLDTVELVMAFEEEFGIEIPDDAAEKILTVKDAVDFIEQAS